MPSKQDYVDAANKAPSRRTAAEQALVDRGSNMQEVRNADFRAREAQRTGR